MIGTPIGNLGDLTARAAESLGSADLIVCEDTRRTRILLSHLSISRPTRSLHRFNEAARVEPLVSLMKEGKTLALVSDAGTPGVSDPGARLVAAARAEGIPVEAIPGPSAPAAALSISGVEAQGYVFAGYPPARTAARRRFFAALLAMERARGEADPGAGAWPIVLFEAPHRIGESLHDMGAVMGDRPVVLLREMTKLHEEALAGKISDVAARLPRPAPRGEFTIVVAPGSPEPGGPLGPGAPGPRDLRRAYGDLVESGVDRKEALKRLALRWSLPKKEVYRAVLGGGGGSGEPEDPEAS